VNNIEVHFVTSARSGARRWLFALSLASVLWVSAVAEAATESVTLAWDPSPDPTVTGYHVYYGTASRVYSAHVDSGGATQATVEGLLPEQTYFFAVTAYNQERFESAPSGEVVYTVPSPVQAPMRAVRGSGTQAPGVRFRVKPKHPYEVQASEDLVHWRTIHQSVSLSTNWLEYNDPEAARLPRRFYRLALPNTAQVPGWMDHRRGPLPQGTVLLRPLVAAGQGYQIQVSSDLKTWAALHEGVSAASQPLDLMDTQTGSGVPRFYRLALTGPSPGYGPLQLLTADASSRSQLRIAALTGQHYRVEASTDLVTWQVLGEGVATSTEPVNLVDPQSVTLPNRFYRIAFD
jgi:hypothetical protein